MKQHASIILASGSPRRQALLKELGVEFSVVLHDIDESFPAELKREEVAEYLARKKASAYASEISNNHTVITADTIVCAGDTILNKAAGPGEAMEMLRTLSGRQHQVITAVCVSNREITRCFHVSTTVVFKQLTTEEIRYYIDRCKPFDKAGAYGIQEWIGLTGIERIEGSYYNVVGLPVKELYEVLTEMKLLSIP